MDEDRIARAMARIEEAARRIEACSMRPAGVHPDLELARKYETLRSETNTALVELDRMIGSLEG